MPPPPELMEELVEEVLLRLPPDDPASLARAALVCKLWHRLVSGAAFHRRFLEFHRSTAPLLGVIYSEACKLRHHDDYTPSRDTDTDPQDPMRHATADPHTSSPRPPSALYTLLTVAAVIGVPSTPATAASCSILLYPSSPSPSPWMMPARLDLSIWDPVTDEQQDLPKLPFNSYYSAAVACDFTAGGNCDHLDCHRRPFRVVVIDIQPRMTNLFVYSSEAGAWSQLANFERQNFSFHYFFQHAPGVLMGSALYFLVHCNDEIFKYDLATLDVFTIRLPSKFRGVAFRRIVLVTDDDGGLGFVANMEYKLELWSMVDAGDAGFVLRRVIDLRKVLPSGALVNKSSHVSGFADCGSSRLLLMRTSDGIYIMEINSSQVKKVAPCCDYDDVVVPYVSFCTPTSRL